jgi:hypothetical protein
MKFFKRFHVLNFIYSLFTVVSGYRFVINGPFKNKRTLNFGDVVFIFFDATSFAMAHGVLGIYLCCPKVAFDQPQVQNS